MDETFLEKAWNDLLSREPERIESCFKSLDVQSQTVVIDHLKLMITDEGWHPEQVVSAQQALNTLVKLG